MEKNIAEIRQDYVRHSLRKKDVDKDPIKQFQKWLTEALTAEVREATAMNMATVSEQGVPSSRILLLKDVNKNGFTFYTNYQSSKARELEVNPSTALTFFWPELERQVRIQGIVKKVSKEESEEYFKSRPRKSQIGAWASPQSSVISSREILEEREQKLEKKFEGQDTLPKPEQWGGYIVEPFFLEFWQGRASRLHDRIVYTREDNTWKINRLAP
ncbi:pyridoxamine 5'-phosphate oxidase [Fulvivirga sp. 29W222]|uniref:Pyridoxine/pyridoxamine 5'-phosphate oxidase n=1 Tax=Fulvivirga marina TaxID=2494733 RepID=A0A937KDA3_9BACT|nr:pyridoxamine 5'-phosphate oxidase [Fulvivirga marina]MBL6448936.1 pyridoxamine 5'-phosphate oxidase [Fulvivirga marina]